MVAPDRVLSTGQIEQTVCKQTIDVKLRLLYSSTWNYLTVCKKKSSGSFKNVIYKMCSQIVYIFDIYMSKQDLALNNQQCLICNKTQPNQIIYI